VRKIRMKNGKRRNRRIRGRKGMRKRRTSVKKWINMRRKR
jgi:hypothetical protein